MFSLFFLTRGFWSQCNRNGKAIAALSPNVRSITSGSSNIDAEIDAVLDMDLGLKADKKEKPNYFQRPKSDRYIEFQKKLDDDTAEFGHKNELKTTCDYEVKDNLEAYNPFPNNINPITKEFGGPPGPEPTRYGDWQFKGIVTDF